MKILSAFEDFEQVTLSRFAGVLERLVYVAGLRKAGGEYAHWGLAKAYGRDAAAKAMAQAHSRAFAQYLRAPLEQLAGEMAAASSKQGISTTDYLEPFAENRGAIRPQVKTGGSARHSDAVLLALAKIARSGRCEDRRSA